MFNGDDLSGVSKDALLRKQMVFAGIGVAVIIVCRVILMIGA